jgi:hypothetical protein
LVVIASYAVFSVARLLCRTRHSGLIEFSKQR